jgi:hypothetical protein
MMNTETRPAGPRALAGAALALAAVMSAAPAAAQLSPPTPAAGTPFSTRDAFIQDRGVMKLEGVLGYERGRDGTDRYEPQPAVKYGLTDAVELRLGSGYALGNASGTDRGSVAGGLQWLLFDEAEWRPAVALLGEVSLPFGPGDAGAVTELSAIASRTTGRGPGAWGLHLNAGWLARPDPGTDERRHGHRLGAALSHVVGPDTVLVAGYAQQAQDLGEKDLSLIEGGVEHRLGDAAVALAVGAGLNDDSPRLQVTLALQYTFNLAGSR